MLNALASALGDKMAEGAIVAAIGILVVFSILALLVVIIEVVARINKKAEANADKIKGIFKFRKKSKKEAEAEVATPATAITVAPNAGGDAATVAAITAALSLVLRDENGADDGSRFVIKKIKKLTFRR